MTTETLIKVGVYITSMAVAAGIIKTEVSSLKEAEKEHAAVMAGHEEKDEEIHKKQAEESGRRAAENEAIIHALDRIERRLDRSDDRRARTQQ